MTIHECAWCKRDFISDDRFVRYATDAESQAWREKHPSMSHGMCRKCYQRELARITNEVVR